jgi:DNA recombination protein RmuC
MEILAIILSAITIILIVVIIVFFAKNARKTDGEETQFLQNDLANLRRDLNDLSQNLAKNLDENSEKIREKVDQKLDQTQRGMNSQMENSRKIVEEITKSLTKLEETNRHVVDTQSELKERKTILTNNKTRGNLGEYYLNDILENVLPHGVWEAQYHFKNGDAVDAIVRLKDKKILPIDSKFPMQNYERALNGETKEIRETAKNELKRDIKGRIDETAKYIRPEENTMDFAFMFIPSESLYYDAIINEVGVGANSRNLIDYAYRDKKVIIVSPTTLLAYLQTVIQGLRSLQIEEQTKEIQKWVSQLGNHLAKYDEHFNALGKNLGTVVNKYQLAASEFAKIDKDVVKITSGESGGNLLEAVNLQKPREE